MRKNSQQERGLHVRRQSEMDGPLSPVTTT